MRKYTVCYMQKNAQHFFLSVYHINRTYSINPIKEIICFSFSRSSITIDDVEVWVTFLDLFLFLETDGSALSEEQSNKDTRFAFCLRPLVYRSYIVSIIT